MPPMPFPYPPPPRRGGRGGAILIALLLLLLVGSGLLNLILIAGSMGERRDGHHAAHDPGRDRQRQGRRDPVARDHRHQHLRPVRPVPRHRRGRHRREGGRDRDRLARRHRDRVGRDLQPHQAASSPSGPIPVVVSMGSLATSGGYYAACGADHVFAQPTTFTGNIGVLMPRYNFSKLMEKYGVEETTIVSDRRDLQKRRLQLPPRDRPRKRSTCRSWPTARSPVQGRREGRPQLQAQRQHRRHRQRQGVHRQERQGPRA